MKLQHEKEEQAAALKVQSMQRGKIARKRVNGIKQQGQVEIKSAALKAFDAAPVCLSVSIEGKFIE